MARRFVSILSALMLLTPSWAAPAQAAGEGRRVVVIRDAETETLLRTFATPLFRAAGLDPAAIRITVIRDPAINAFVTSGNRLFVNTGMIEQCDSALELIGALAHETGHLAGHHVARLPEQERAALLKAIAAALLGAAAGAASGSGDVAAAAMLGGQQLAMRGFFSFTRGQEEAADQAGLRLLDDVHWSASGLAALFRRLSGQEALVVSGQDPYLLTHPLSQERIAFIEHHLAASPWRDALLPVGFESRFQLVRAKLVGFLEPAPAVLRRYPASDRSAPARYARAVTMLRAGHTDAAVALIDGLIGESRDSPWLHELKGQALFEGGRIAPALAAERKAALLAPDQPLILAGEAQVMVESGDAALLPQAARALEGALAHARNDPSLWHDLGIAYGRMGRIGQADLALAEEALLKRDIPAARGFARRAQTALPPGPSRLRAQDIANAVSKENRMYDEDSP